jgi:hypothetical protein
MKKIPKYRIDKILKIYNVFCDKNKNNVNLKDRKIKFKKIIKIYYSWLTDDE